MTIELLTWEEIEALDTLAIDDLPADDGDCLILDSVDALRYAREDLYN